MKEKEVIIRDRGTGKLLTGILIGAAVGGIVALLNAPKTGEEMRSTLGERTQEFRDMAAEKVDDTRHKAMRTISNVRETAGSRLNRTRDETMEALERENRIMEDEQSRSFPL